MYLFTAQKPLWFLEWKVKYFSNIMQIILRFLSLYFCIFNLWLIKHSVGYWKSEIVLAKRNIFIVLHLQERKSVRLGVNSQILSLVDTKTQLNQDECIHISFDANNKKTIRHLSWEIDHWTRASPPLLLRARRRVRAAHPAMSHHNVFHNWIFASAPDSRWFE